VDIRPHRPLAVLGALVIALTVAGSAQAAAPLTPEATAPQTPPAVASTTASTSAPVQPDAFTLSITPFRTGLRQPIFATNAGDGTNRVYIVEKAGLIKVLSSSGGYLGTMLDIRDRTSRGSEQGLLGLAFHPDYEHNHRYYVDYTDRSGDTVIVEYKTGSSGLTTVSGRRLIVIGQPYANHNGGMLAFGVDGYLYIGMGDGGSGGDPGDRAQRSDSLLGKILRMDVDHHPSYRAYGIPPSNPYVNQSGLDLIFAKGLRNPWRFSFDRDTHALWIGDVGQARYEEIDRRANTDEGPGPGANYGWRRWEGRHCYNPSSGCSASGKTMPLIEYPHTSGGDDNCTVIGGYVYRGSAYPAMAGDYLYADLCSHRIWAVDAGAAAPAAGTQVGIAPGPPVAFGETESGELLLVTISGGVYRLGAS
jgi:glucose/arabinose dehydrogenase